MLWEMAGCYHSKEVITWGQHVETKIPGRSVSISIKVWQKADRFASRISAFFPLPASPARNAVGCREARASRFPAVRQPIWKGARSLAPRLPNFQATWQAAWHADRKPGRPWELLSPSTQIRSALGQLRASKAPELQGNRSAASLPWIRVSPPRGKRPPAPKPLCFLFQGFWEVCFKFCIGRFFFLKRFNHSKNCVSFFFLYSLLKHCDLAEVLAHN